MWHRVSTVFRAGFAAQWGAGVWPAAPIVSHGTVAAVLCGLASGALPPFAYALFALAVSGALLALPFLGDFGALLRSDPAAEWVETLPVSRFELRLARTLLILFSVGVLSLAALLPAMWFAPDSAGWSGRLTLLVAGLAQGLAIVAVLVALQSALGDRAEALLVLLQTLLFTGIALGLVVGLRWVPRLTHLEGPMGAAEAVAFLPPAWFASYLAPPEQTPLWPWRVLPALLLLGSLVILAVCPLPHATRARSTGGWASSALAPLRALATRVWLGPGERASFDLVFDALPLEREFVLRTYPMVGIPLAFLVAGSGGDPGAAREALLAVLLFMPVAYLPILLVHVPASASHEARWILDTSPLPREAHAGGAIKAVALRFLVPLYAALFLLAWSQAGLAFAIRLALPAALFSTIVLRQLYPMFVHENPLSVAPDAIEAKMDWAGVLAGLGIGSTLVAILAAHFVTSLVAGLALTAVLVGVERLLDRYAAKLRGLPSRRRADG